MKDPRLWAVIANTRMCSPIDLLDSILHDAILSNWHPPLYPELPAIDEPLAVEAEAATRATSAGFLLACCDCTATKPSEYEGAHLALVSGSKERGQEKDDEATAEAVIWSTHNSQMWIDVGGACLPVKAGLEYGAWLALPGPWTIAPTRRLGFARTRFEFGDWSPLQLGEPVEAKEDGFLAVNARSVVKDQFGYVEISADGALLTGVAVEESLSRACACVPVRAKELITAKATFLGLRGEPRPDADLATLATARWIPLGEGWSFGQREPVQQNTRLTAETDGVLHALLDAGGVGPGGAVRLYGAAADSWSGTAVHYYPPLKRLVKYGSALLPVGKGASYRSSYTPIYGMPKLSLTWTPIVRSDE